MPSPKRRSRDRRSRSGSPMRRPRRSRSRSPRRRSRSPRRRSRSPGRRSRSPKWRSPRRSRTHSPYRKALHRSGSRSRKRQSLSPRPRNSPSPRGRPVRRRSSSRGRRGGMSPRGDSRKSPKVRPQGRRSPRRSPKRAAPLDHDDRWQSPPSASDSRKKRRSSPEPRNSPEPYSNTGKKSEFISGITVITPIRRMMLSERFETDEQKQQGEIMIEDNIVIAIQRGPNVRNASPMEINREFDPNHVVIMRRKDEGSVPIFDREEIKIFGFDSILDENVYEERRIISVVPASNTTQTKRNQSPEIIRRIQPQTEVKLNFTPDPRYEPLLKLHGNSDSDQEKVRIKRVQKNPNDLRHSLSSKRTEEDGDSDRFDARKKIEAKRKEPESRKDNSDRVFNRLGDRSNERRRDRSRDRQSDRQGSGRNRDSDSSRDRSERRDRGDKNKLPDFKNRPDRFQYDEWKVNPEMIPKNPIYFEHDNREGERGFSRRGRGFRGRSSFRGRGRGFRGDGGFRGRGRGYSSSGRERESTWKHDLFDKLKDEEEEKPSSTTKN